MNNKTNIWKVSENLAAANREIRYLHSIVLEFCRDQLRAGQKYILFDGQEHTLKTKRTV